MILRCGSCWTILILGIIHYAQSDSKYKHEESNEDANSNFNVVSSLSGGTQNSRHHTQTNFDLSPAESNRPVGAPYPHIGFTRSYGGEKSYEQLHYGHNHAAGADCTEASLNAGGGHEIDEPHGHERTGGITHVNRNGNDFGRQSPYGPPYPLHSQGQYNPVNPQPGQSHIYPSLPQANYPMSWPSQYPSQYPLPGHSHLYPNLPTAPGQSQHHHPGYPIAGHQPSYPMPYPAALPSTNSLHNQHDHSYGNKNRGYDHLDHTFKMNTEYKEDGIHSGPTNKLTNNGYGFGSGYGGGYNGAFNQPGY